MISDIAGKPISLLAYPAVTVCSQGYDLTAVEDEVQRGFQGWLETFEDAGSSASTDLDPHLDDSEVNTESDKDELELSPDTDQLSDQTNRAGVDNWSGNNHTANGLDSNNAAYDRNMSDINGHGLDDKNKSNNNYKEKTTSQPLSDRTISDINEQGLKEDNKSIDDHKEKTTSPNSRKKRSTSKTDKDLFLQYSQEVFGITEPDVSIMDIVHAMTSQNPESSIASAGVQNAVASCEHHKRKKRSSLLFTQGPGYCPPNYLTRSSVYCLFKRPVRYQTVDIAKAKCEKHDGGSLIELSDSKDWQEFTNLVTAGLKA